MPRTKLVNGVVVNFTAEEETARDIIDQAHQDNLINIKLKQLRNTRNQLLNECDWTDLPNAVLTDEKKSEWQTYRTNLRDLTNGLTTAEEVNAVVFPEKPSE